MSNGKYLDFLTTGARILSWWEPRGDSRQ